MGNCWLKQKKARHNNSNESNKNYSSNSTTIEDKAKIKTETNNQQQNSTRNNAASSFNETNKKQLVVLQPRRDCLDTGDLELSLICETAVGTTQTTTTSTTNFKQFCKNSADRLSHKLSFNKNKQQHAHSDNDTISESKIINLYDKYKDDKETNSILANGIQQLCNDLNLKPDDFKILLLAWKLNAKQMCKFTKEEFLNGFKSNLKVDNLKDLKLKLAFYEDEIKLNANEFKSLYRWTFDFGLDTESGERAIPLEMAICLWQLVYTNQEPPLLSKWLKFLFDHVNIKGIPRDTWNMFPLFAKSIGEFNYHLYDDNEAWPCLFDDFVQAEIAINNLDINNNNCCENNDII